MRRPLSSAVLSLVASCTVGLFASSRELQPRIALRPIVYRNVAYASTGRYFAIPNFVTAGSVAMFSVSEKGAIARIPPRLSEKNFARAAGIFYYVSAIEGEPEMAFVSLPELLSGYSVAFSPSGDTLAIAGGDRVWIHSAKKWTLEKTIVVAEHTVRAVFSPSTPHLAAVAGGVIHYVDRVSGTVVYTVSPEADLMFGDVAFSGDGKWLAAFEYRESGIDHVFRIRIFEAEDGSEEHRMPFFPEKLSPGAAARFPLVSFLPGDTALAANVEKPLFSKVLIVDRSGNIVREFKGSCHGVSPDGAFFAAGNRVYRIADWHEVARLGGSPRTLAFSPTEPVVVVITDESMRRYRIEP